MSDPYRIVLAVVDGTAASEIAAEIGAALAGRSGAALHIAAVGRPGEAKLDLGDLARAAEPGSREFHEHLREHVDELATSLGERCDCPIEQTVLTADDPSEGLTDYERRVGVDLTVLGVHRAGDGNDLHAYRRLSDDVERRVPSPVLLVPSADTADERTGEPRITNGDAVAVLVGPPDLADADAPLLPQAAAFARASGATLWVIDAAGAAGLFQEDGRDTRVRAGTRNAGTDRIADAMRAGGLDVRQAGLRGDHPHEELSKLLREEPIGTVALGPDGRRTAERLLLTPLGDANDQAAGARVAVLLCPASPGVT